MLVRKLTQGLTHAGGKPYTVTYSSWWETSHWGLLMLVGNLKMGLTHAGGKPYPGTYSCWWETLHWDLLLLVRNLTLGLTLRHTHEGEKPYSKTTYASEKNLTFTLIHTDDKPYMETNLWWRQTLHRDLLKLYARHHFEAPYLLNHNILEKVTHSIYLILCIDMTMQLNPLHFSVTMHIKIEINPCSFTYLHTLQTGCDLGDYMNFTINWIFQKP